MNLNLEFCDLFYSLHSFLASLDTIDAARAQFGLQPFSQARQRPDPGNVLYTSFVSHFILIVRFSVFVSPWRPSTMLPIRGLSPVFYPANPTEGGDGAGQGLSGTAGGCEMEVHENKFTNPRSPLPHKSCLTEKLEFFMLMLRSKYLFGALPQFSFCGLFEGTVWWFPGPLTALVRVRVRIFSRPRLLPPRQGSGPAASQKPARSLFPPHRTP